MRRVVRSLAFFAAAAAVVATGQAASTKSAAADVSPFEVRQVSPQVHVLTMGNDDYGPVVGNVVIIEQANGVVVVDTGGGIGYGRKVAAYVRSLTSKPVKAVVLTHWHGDHSQGVEALKQEWPALRVITTPGTKIGLLGPERQNLNLQPDPAMDRVLFDKFETAKAEYRTILEKPDTSPERKERIGKVLARFDAFYDNFRGSYLVPPTETFDRLLRIPDSKAPVELRYFGRANTEGDAVIWLPKQKIVATGDIVVYPVPFGINSYPAEWLATLRHIKALGFRTLIPGHGEPMSDAGFVDKLIASIDTIRNKVDTAVKAGMSFREIKAKVDLSSEADRFGTTPRLKDQIPDFWTEPMTINAYKEAKRLPIRQGATEPDPN